MSAWIIALLATVSASTWLFTKLQRYSGNNTQQSIIATSVAGLIFFGVLLSILSLIL